MEKPWIKPGERMPEPFKLVFVATFDAKHEEFQYFVGWFNENTKEWYLADNGYTEDVAFWMPIPEIKVSDLDISMEKMIAISVKEYEQLKRCHEQLQKHYREQMQDVYNEMQIKMTDAIVRQSITN